MSVIQVSRSVVIAAYLQYGAQLILVRGADIGDAGTLL